MLDMLSRYWWLVGLRGIVSILFGVFAILWPATAFVVLVIFFGAYAMADGVLALIALIGGSRRPWELALEAVVGIGIGLVTLFTPGITAAFMLALAGIMAIMTGVFEIVAAFRLRKEIANELFLGIAGVVSVIFGIAMLAAPTFGIFAVGIIVGFYALTFGIALVSLAMKLRQHRPASSADKP
jgi:uncharacterized membrane protein HdeD (DUF308 family)